MTDIRKGIAAALNTRRANQDRIDRLYDAWVALTGEVDALVGAVAEISVRIPLPARGTAEGLTADGGISGELGASELGELRRAMSELTPDIATIRARFHRATVNIGVVGQAAAGKSTLLRTITGLSDVVIPSGGLRPATAARSRVQHSPGRADATVTLRTWEEFRDGYLRPLHAGAGFEDPVPATPDEFTKYPYGAALDRAHNRAPVEQQRFARRLRVAQASFPSYRALLEQPGRELRIDQMDRLRPFVAYPPEESQDRPYHAVRDVRISCEFSMDDAANLVFVDLPGAGEAGLDVERQFLADLRNDVDVLLQVKRPVLSRSWIGEDDWRVLRLADRASMGVDLADFVNFVVNTDPAHVTPEQLSNVVAEARTEITDANGLLLLVGDVASGDEVREQILRPVLEGLGRRLAVMDQTAAATPVRQARSVAERVDAAAGRVAEEIRRHARRSREDSAASNAQRLDIDQLALAAAAVRAAAEAVADAVQQFGLAVSGGDRDFFVSYSHADRAWAEWIAWALEEDGYRVLIQAWDFVPGSRWIGSMEEGGRQSNKTIAVLSDAYLRSSHGAAEWQAAWASDPSGTKRKLLVARVADCERPGLLAGIVSADLFGIPEATARSRLRELAGGVRSRRAKPAASPAFPAYPAGPRERPGDMPAARADTAYPSVSAPAASAPAASAPGAGARVWEVVEVFQPTGVPGVTFVQPEWFAEFLMALRQPGLSIVLEGPSGAGKTTLLQHAVEHGERRLGHARMLTARDPGDVAAITELVGGGDHQGITAIDDFHRLPPDLQARVIDYLKLLADRGDRTRKLVIVGIPKTAQSLVRVSFDVANRIREFRLGWAGDRQVLGLIEQGENALNIAFDDKPALVAAAGGSLITAQSLCWHLVGLARIEETLPDQLAVPTDIGRARESVFRELRLKYHEAVAEFTSLDDRAESACIDLLLALAAEPDGVLYLDGHAGQAAAARSALARLTGPAGPASESISRVLYYDPKGRRLIADDPQFVFYIRHLDRLELLREAGKRLPPPRHRVFICYSHANAPWMQRLLVHLGPLDKDNLVDVWSDERIRPGDDWRAEIDAALAAARFAVLLVSADFYNSVFIRGVELPSLLAASDTGGCKVMPLLVSASRFPSDPALSRFQAATGVGRTLAAMTAEEAEEVLADLAAVIHDEIRRVT